MPFRLEQRIAPPATAMAPGLEQSTTQRERRRGGGVARPLALAASVIFAAAGFSTLLSSDSAPSLRKTRALDDGMCENIPVLHDLDPKVVEKYDRMITNDKANFDGYDMPTLVTLEGFGKFRTHVRERNWPARSMAWNTTFTVEEDPSIDEKACHDKEMGVWQAPPTDAGERTEGRVVKGNYAAFSGWYVGNFGHFVHDHVPIIAWLKSQVSEDTKFLLPYHKVHKSILKVVDPTFVAERVVWIQYDETVLVEGKLTVVVPKVNAPFLCGFPQTGSAFTEHLRSWLEESHADTWAAKAREPKKVIYATRKGVTQGGVKRRNMDQELEDRIVTKIRASMVENGRSEDDLVIFSGKDEFGRTLSIQAQFDLFSSADVVIGPHGSALTNMIWMDPTRRPCGSQPKVVEFASSQRTPQVQAGSFSAYWFLFGTMPWIEYHHLYYTEASTGETVVVDFEAFEEALGAVWGRGDGAVAKSIS